MGHDNWLTDFEGRGLASLQHPDAAEVLTGALDLDANPGRRTIMLTSLANACLSDEPERAAAVATEAFDLATRTGYAVAYPALDEVRSKLPDDVPGVAGLGERLATV